VSVRRNRNGRDAEEQNKRGEDVDRAWKFERKPDDTHIVSHCFEIGRRALGVDYRVEAGGWITVR
jgi:hypothetical protein